jgi:hypothetical protein
MKIPGIGTPGILDTVHTPLDIERRYREQLASRQAALAGRERAHARFSHVRLIIAASGAAILIIGGLDTLAWVLLPLGLFVLVAVAHGRLLNARDRAASAVGFYERGLARIAHAWVGRGRAGDAYRPADHLYAEDLDIFGRGSIFELLATARTQAGEETLARWLLAPSPHDLVRQRQDAVRELTGRLDLREQVAVLGDQLRIGVDASLLRQWSHSPVRLRGTAARAGLALLAAVTTAGLLWWLATGTLGGGLLVIVLVQLGVVQWLKPRVLAVIHAVEEPSHDLDLLSGLLRTIERERFTSPHLVQLQTSIGTGDHRASAEIGRLAQLVAILSSRQNVLFAPVSALWIWATQWAFAIEAWRTRAGVHIPRWLDTVGEFEALLALGTFAAEHPSFVFPDLADPSTRTLQATALAHPTLPPDAVVNDVALGGDAAHLLVVSGSNMSGKSTFLRAIGVNVVLAQMGAPVRARAFRLSPLAVGSTISVHDSLTEGRSRFFAEITRLKHVVDLTRERNGAVLFLLDEILSGTNSHDRRIGAEALLVGLVRDGTIGLVTTHDLALGEITQRLRSAVNMHFEDRFEQGVLAFDYTLRPGIVRTSNAIALMRSIGLEV